MDPGFIGILGGYLIGSIPFGLLVAKLTGTPDPRKIGSKNIGFTNVLRVCGKKAGALTLLGDMGKGFVVTVMGKYLGFSWTWVLAFGLAVIIGHIFSLFLSFKGGKGVATALGAIGGLHGIMGLMLIGVWLTSVFAFKYSSGGALMAFGAFPLFVILLSGDMAFLIFSILVTGLIFFCHKDNIIRLYHGVEPKIGSTRN
ncbi:MAG: glycerol-3-phosphate 1-O-acyltransferase PlsY [Nitrospirales bacterium]|nr:glycerol-3-phosphate 1-O-acyltransferase PlsY [Nitrospirales bacterium]